MKKKFVLSKYILQLLFGLLCSFIGQILLIFQKDTWSTLSNTYKSFTFMQSIANHALAGIVLAFIGFILLFYLIFTTAFLLLSHWYTIQLFLRIFGILWMILLCISTLYHAVTLYHILGYIFIVSIIIFSILLILNYFDYEA